LLNATVEKVTRMEGKMSELTDRQNCNMLLHQKLDLTLTGMALLLTSDRHVDNATWLQEVTDLQIEVPQTNTGALKTSPPPPAPALDVDLQSMQKLQADGFQEYYFGDVNVESAVQTDELPDALMDKLDAIPQICRDTVQDAIVPLADGSFLKPFLQWMVEAISRITDAKLQLMADAFQKQNILLGAITDAQKRQSDSFAAVAGPLMSQKIRAPPGLGKK